MIDIGHNDLTAKHWYLRFSRPPDVDGIKIFDKDDQAINVKMKRMMLCSLVIFIKNFDPINIRKPWALEIPMFRSEVIITKTYISIKSRGHWLPIWFHIFFNKIFLVLGHSFFTPGCFGLDNNITRWIRFMCSNKPGIIIQTQGVYLKQKFWI